MTRLATADLGHGWAKSLSCGRVWREPAVLGEAKQLFDEQIRPTDIIYDNRLFVGNLALRHSDIKYAGTKDEKAANWTTEILLRTALMMIAGSEPVNLVTGLPIDFYFSQKSAFESMLNNFKSEFVQIQIGRETRKENPSIKQFKIVPQPLGAAMDYLLDDLGNITNKEVAKKRILIIDLGYYTLDLLILDAMEIGKASCSPPNLGVDTAYKLIQSYLKENFGRSPARYELDQYIIKGSYEGYNIQPLIEKAFKALATQIKLEIESLNLSFDLILLVGGAANLVNPYLNLKLEVPLDPQLANARGYGKIGARLWRNL